MAEASMQAPESRGAELDEDEDFIIEDERDALKHIQHQKERDFIRDKRAYYKVLNVDINATLEEIRKSYVWLAAQLHPDRHSNSLLQKESIEQFRYVDEAYRVLTDPLQRQAYDLYGDRGLKLLNGVNQYEMIPVRYPLELSYILDGLSSQDMEYQGIAKQPCSGSVAIQTHVPGFLRAPQLEQISVHQHVQQSLTPLMDVFGGVNVINRGQNGVAMGYIGSNVNLGEEATASVSYLLQGKKKRLTIKSRKKVSESTSVGSSLSVSGNGTLMMSCTSDRRLNNYLTVSADVAVGFDEAEEGLGFGVKYKGSKVQGDASLRLSNEGVTLRGACDKRISEKIQVNCVGTIGTSTIECLVGGTRCLNELSGVHLALSVSFSRGVILRLKFYRGGQSLILPIKISQSLNPSAILIGSLINAALNSTLSYIIQPFEKMRVQRTLRDMAKTVLAKQAKARRNAASQVRLMVEPAEHKAQIEKNNDGLVIVEAYYICPFPVSGDPSTAAFTTVVSRYNPNPPDPTWFEASRDENQSLDMASSLDVRIPLQFFVNKSRLYLPPGSKAGILGFYDISANPTWLLQARKSKSGAKPLNYRFDDIKNEQRRPHLYVRYVYKKYVYETSVEDIQPLELPPSDNELKVTCLGREGEVL